MSSTLRAQLSLPEVQFRKGFQLILHGFTAVPGEHGDDSNLPPAGCLHPLHGDMILINGDVGFLLSSPTRRLWGLCRRGWAGTLPIAEERRTGRHGANGRVFTNGFELLNRFRQCCRERFSFFTDTPHYPSRKNSVVNTPESKVPVKDLRSRVCNRHPRRPTLGVLLTPNAKKIGRQALVKSVCRW